MKKSLIFILILEIIYQWFSVKNVFSQTYAGESKFHIKGSSGVVLGATTNPLWCYTWEPATGLSDPKSPNPIASPEVTTKYKVKVVGYNFSFTAVDEVTVYVLNGVKLEIESNLSECMEERDVTFTAKIMSDAPLPLEVNYDIEYVFHYKKADGSNYTQSEKSNNTIIENTMATDKVADGDADHKYNIPAYVEASYMDGTLTSDIISFDVYELWIEYVRYDETRPWKVMVGDDNDIEYSAIASSDCKNWKWTMEDGVPDVWHPTGGDKKTGTFVIPYSDLPNAKNSYFGDAYGTVTVTCEDGEGNKYTLNSTDMTPSQKVKVFFDPDVDVDGNLPYGKKYPCWFVFWKDGEVIEDIGQCGYLDSLDYGAYYPWLDSLFLGPYACTENSGNETLTDLDGNKFIMTGSGRHIHCVAETMSHELYHIYVTKNFASVLPQTDSDELPDGEEAIPHADYFKRSLHDNPDSFNWVKDPKGSYKSYADQEVRCRIIEISEGVKKVYPEKDWSADEYNSKW